MAKAKSQAQSRKPQSPRASEEQLSRMEYLGRMLYGDSWPSKKLKLFRKPMTPERAKEIISTYQGILGTKV